MMKTSLPYIKYPLAGLTLAGALLYPAKSYTQLKIQETAVKTDSSNFAKKTFPTTDVFIKMHGVTPQGTDDPEVLSKAPSPDIMVNGKLKKAKIVVDLSTNILYHYDDIGNTLKAYLISSGRVSGKQPTPTDPGVRCVSRIEYYNYRSAPPNTKRYKSPKDFGPMIIILNKLDPKTGIISKTGEFIHGNRRPDLLGQYVSHGCMRMDNDVIQFLAPQMKRGDIVIIKPNKNLKK